MPAMYLQNKYTKWYFNIVENAKNRTIDGYTEKHHVTPKSLGGDNSKENLVKLTAREHFICHWLLTKMLIGKSKYKMLYALRLLNGNYKQNSRVYEYTKQIVRGSMPLETKIKISNTMKGRPAHNKGKPCNNKIRNSKGSNGKLIGRIRPKIICPHCLRHIDEANYHRYHGDKCQRIKIS